MAAMTPEEREFLAALVQAPDAADLVSSDDLSPPGQLIREAVVDLHRTKAPVSLQTVVGWLRTRHTFDEAGGRATIEGLLGTGVTGAHVAHYAATLRALAGRRKLNAEIKKLAGEKLSPLAYAESVAAATERAKMAAAEQSEMTPLLDVLLSATREIDHAVEHGAPPVISTGLRAVDDIITGLGSEQLVIVAGRPAMGKTSLAMGWALSCARAGGKVAVFSYEMSGVALAKRMLMAEARVDATRAKRGQLGHAELDRISRAAREMTLDVWFDDKAGSVAQITPKLKHLKASRGLDLVVVDYIQLMTPSDPRAPREQQVSGLSRDLKKLAMTLHVPVVALSQLSRQVEGRVDKRPGMADLRESGGIENDADVVVMVYRDEVYNKETQDKGVAELIVVKQREGALGTARVAFQAHHTRFVDLAEGPTYEEPPTF